MYLRTTLSDSSSLFVCLNLFLIIFLFLHCVPLSEFIAGLTFFFFFCITGTVLGPMYFSTAVASAGCFFYFWLSLVCLYWNFGLSYFFSLLPESMIGIYAWLSLRKQPQTSRYFLSLFWHSLSSDSLQPVFEVWYRVRSLISRKLCVWFPRLCRH